MAISPGRSPRQPVWFYLENFLHFLAGTDVPSGFYNKEKGQWEAEPSGRVMKIVSITAGAADLDVTGDGTADTGATLAALSITDGERQELAAKYTAGQSLWRVPIPHFTPWDCNWAAPLGAGAGAPSPGAPKTPKPVDKPNDPPNVYIQNQTSGEQIDVTGTPLTLNYRSNRVAGYSFAHKLTIPLSGAALPGAVQRIDLDVTVAGRTTHQEFAPAKNLVTTFEWDGLDAYGRAVQGAQGATVRISNIYRSAYAGTLRFGDNGEFALAGDPIRGEGSASVTYQVTLGNLDIRSQSIGGWTFDVHHTYDPAGRVLYLGDGTTRSVGSLDRTIKTFAGTGKIGTAASDPWCSASI